MDNEPPPLRAIRPAARAPGVDERRRLLGTFLRRRRGLVAPDAYDLPISRRRRVAGLRREEVALLAGISVTWYSQLESGAEITVSLALLDRIGDVLRLGPLERAYVFSLGLEELGVMRAVLPELALAAGARIAGERFEEEVAGALRAHRSIKTQIYGATLQGTQAHVGAHLDETRCPIGLWLQDDLAPALRGTPAYERATRAHAAFHREIDRVLAAGAIETPSRAERLLASPGAYAAASASLERAFAEWPLALAR